MSTRLGVIAVVLVCLSAGSSPGQVAAQREAMKKLDFLVGQWKGDGWMEFGPGQRRTFQGTETVQTKVDGLVVTIEGIHRGRVGGTGPEGVIHNAFGLLSYDDKAKRYRFESFTTRGNREDAEAKVSEGQLEWGMTIPRFGDVRYAIKLDDKGQWVETGEVSQGGNTRKFFEMTQRRVGVK